jgi:hypothetical protein
MSSGSVCHVARSRVEVGNFHTRLVVTMIFTAPVRNILDTPSYAPLASTGTSLLYCAFSTPVHTNLHVRCL